MKNIVEWIKALYLKLQLIPLRIKGKFSKLKEKVYIMFTFGFWPTD